MFKVICSTALKTILGLILFFVFLFVILSIAVPSAMGNICEAMGQHSMAAVYYSQSYSYTGDVMDISCCCHNAITAGDDEKIIVYCEKYIKDSYFKNYAKEKEERQYIYGNLACAQYRQGKKSEAFDLVNEAMDGVTGFPTANAFTALSLEVKKAEDKQSAASLLGMLGNFQPLTEQEELTYSKLNSLLEKAVQGN